MNRDGARKSAWQNEIKSFTRQEKYIENTADVLIVGGGITGISTALLLQEKGKNCILIDASNVGFGTTGGTTAHLNTFFDTTFDEAISKYGEENAAVLAKAGPEAIDIIRNNILKHGINCNFEEKTGYLLALDDKQNSKLEKMIEGAQKVGIDMNFCENITFPVPYVSIASVPAQAQFHPLKYINGLAEAFLNLGGMIIEDCVYLSHNEESVGIQTETSRGVFMSGDLVFATHTPPGVNILHLMAAPYRSYVIAFEQGEKKYSEDLVYDLDDPYRYYRTQTVDGQKLFIAGGEDHKTGHEEDTGICFSNLENYMRKHFSLGAAVYSWSSQYYEPVDGLPYIGKLPGSKENVFTATGFRGNGMIFGTLSSQIISDSILGNKNKYEKLFDPRRIRPVEGFGNFVKETASALTDFVKDKIFTDKINSLAELTDGEAKVVKYENESYAIYRESGEKSHVLKSTCPHTYCEVRWNGAEKSWDCPCHGSRFSINGRLLTGPSTEGLQRVFINPDDEKDNS